MDFIMTFRHCECIAPLSGAAFTERHCKWCKMCAAFSMRKKHKNKFAQMNLAVKNANFKSQFFQPDAASDEF